jgi:ribosomal-protein-alanine N-acetyltransferase
VVFARRLCDDGSMAPSVEFSLRKGTLDDIPQLVSLEKKAYPASHAAWSSGHFQSELEKPYSQTYVLTDEETDEKVIGYVVFWIMYDECQILNVAVDPEYRRRGYGLMMVRKAIDAALRQNIQKASLNVRKSNLSAIAIYQKIGFTITHVRKRFYADGEDAYEMILGLTGERVEF